MNKDLINTAVKPNNETEEKAIIALYELAGFRMFNASWDLYGSCYVVVGSFAGCHYQELTSKHQEITLDQLAWDYGLAEDDYKYCILTPEGDVYFSRTDLMHQDSKIISTRPKQKLQNGDYLPVSEIKTEQDFNDVIKAAENCGFNPYLERSYEEFQKVQKGDAYEIWKGELLLVDFSNLSSDNKLTLAEWLERGDVEREEVNSDGVATALAKRYVNADELLTTSDIKEVKEWMPEIGEECLIRCTYDGITWHENRKGFLKGVFDNELWMDVPEGGGDLILLRQNVKFKPLPTPEEVEREEFVNQAITTVGCEIESIPEVFARMFDNGCRFKD